jgi:hypothetical protein
VKSNCNTVSTLAFVQEVFSEEKHALTVGDQTPFSVPVTMRA